MTQPGDEREAEHPQPPPRIVYSSRELFRGLNEIFIEHQQETYCLRITSKGKLLLTK